MSKFPAAVANAALDAAVAALFTASLAASNLVLAAVTLFNASVTCCVVALSFAITPSASLLAVSASCLAVLYASTLLCGLSAVVAVSPIDVANSFFLVVNVVLSTDVTSYGTVTFSVLLSA